MPWVGPFRGEARDVVATVAMCAPVLCFYCERNERGRRKRNRDSSHCRWGRRGLQRGKEEERASTAGSLG